MASAEINSSPVTAERTRSFALPKGSPSVHLDALRGLAAFSVLLNHWRDAFFLDYPELAHHNPAIAAAYLITGLGHQWVIVFFVMSGYLVGGSVLRSVGAGRWSWRGYLLARLTRLYIVLLPALLLGGMADWTGMHLAGTDAVYSGRSGMHALTADVHSTLTLPTLLANGLFLQTIALPGMGGRRVPTFGSNGPLWSLSNEFWYYLAFPLLVLLLAQARPSHLAEEAMSARRRSMRVPAACGLGLAVWGWFVGPAIALLGIPWLMGAAIAYLPPVPLRRRWARGVAIGAALALFGAGLVMGKIWNNLVTDLVLGLVVTLLIWVTLHCATSPLPSGYVRVAQRSARSSYTLYLVHLPLLVLLKASLRLPRVQPGWHACLVSAGLLLCILLYAQLVHEIFEKNTDRVRNWIKLRVMGGSPA
jgi:peptidoglycan/LPS O-acetylase OafA/YrhL